jgi:GNAT superfamily N-acetyltransferase
MTAMAHRIERPRADEAAAVGQAHLAAWLQTYPNEDAGIDRTWIEENIGSVAAPEGIARWRTVIEDAERHPERVFCQVVRSGSGIVGFLCGLRDDVVTLGPMYLLEEARGLGLGSRLMSGFLAWAGNTPMRLWVTAYNDGAIRFYARHGFTLTPERELWRGRLPNVRMVRDGWGEAAPGER